MTRARAASPDEQSLEARLAQVGERVHVNIGPSCNNNCIFCMEEDRANRARTNSALTPARVRSILEARAGAGHIRMRPSPSSRAVSR